MTIITPHYNGTACYNREFSFNMVRQHLWFSNPWKESPPVQSLLGMDTFYTTSHQYHQCQGSLTWPLLPLPTRLAFVYITHNLNSVHGHLAFMVSITLFLDCIYLLRVWSCQLLFDCIVRSSQFALDADLTVISFWETSSSWCPARF